MCTIPPKLANPPIVEAVLDIDCDMPPTLDWAALKESAKSAYQDRYPKLQIVFAQSLQIEKLSGEPPAPQAMGKTQAYQFFQEDTKQLIQVRSQGFSLNRLTPYVRDKKTKWKFRVLKYGGLVRNLSAASVTAWLDKVGVDGAKALARSLPAPYLDDKQTPVVPEPTLTVLQRFGADEDVFNSFFRGLHSFQIYSGDIAAQHLREAEIANAFLSHDTDVIRRWARQEIARSKREEQQARQEQEELGI